MSLPFALLGGGLMVAAWWIPGTPSAAILGWLSTFCIVYVLRRSSHPYRDLYVLGLVMHLGGFYWLISTVQEFGHLPTLAAYGVTLLFALVSSYQQLVVALFSKLGISAAVAWTLSEVFLPRMFPWLVGHTQLGLPILIQISDLAGAYLITFLMFWVCDSLLKTLLEKRFRLTQLFSLLALALTIVYGKIRIDEIDDLVFKGQKHDVVLVQGNISVSEKHDPDLFQKNVETYAKLTAPYLTGDRLVIWPESAIMAWIPADLGNISADTRHVLPRLAGEYKTEWLGGGLTFIRPDKAFNSAIAILSDGVIPSPYNKQILMPFGEYTPFAKTIPFLRTLNDTAGDFTAGDEIKIFPFRNGSLKTAPLICYEDLIPSLARDAVNRGAELLVNLTNDAWYGETVAPFEHHQIASFRAVETHRFFLRVTNTGLTAAIDPVGRTLSSLEIFKPGTLPVQVTPITQKSIYSVVGDLPLSMILIGCAITLMLSGLRKETKT